MGALSLCKSYISVFIKVFQILHTYKKKTEQASYETSALEKRLEYMETGISLLIVTHSSVNKAV